MYRVEAIYGTKPNSHATVRVTGQGGQEGHFIVQFALSGDIGSVRHIGAGSVGGFGIGASFRRPGPHLMDLIRQAAHRARVDAEAMS